MPSEDYIKEARKGGAIAFREGKTKDANPHRFGTALHNAWNAGFDAAKRLQQINYSH